METNVDYSGADILNKSGVETQYVCAELCALTEGGLFWTYAVEDKQCYVKGSASGRTNREGHISGNIDCVRGEMRKLTATPHSPTSGALNLDIERPVDCSGHCYGQLFIQYLLK